MMKIQRTNFLIAAGAILCFSSTSVAGVILQSPAPVASGPGLGFATVAAIVTLTANNDNVPGTGAADNNIAVPLKRFDSNNYIDLTFATQASGGTTEYQFSEFVDNNTGTPWIGYDMQIGRGTGANFVPLTLNDGLDFDAPNYDTLPSSAAFAFVATPNEDELHFTGGVHGSGAQQYMFRVDVPDLAAATIPTFTIRQTPIAEPNLPEPTSFVLAALAFAGTLATRRSK